MKPYSKGLDTESAGDRELADVLTAISVVSKRLARKLTAASEKSKKLSEERPPGQKGPEESHEALRD